MTLPDADVSFFWAAMAQLEPEVRPVFAERVARILGSHPAPDCGDVDRAVRAALAGLWVPTILHAGIARRRGSSGSRSTRGKVPEI